MNGLEDISGRTNACMHGRDSLGLQRLRRETKKAKNIHFTNLKIVLGEGDHKVREQKIRMENGL